MEFLGSKQLETKRLILHKIEEKDLKELWNILCLEEVRKYYLTTKINYDGEEEKNNQYKKLESASNKDVFVWTIELKDTNEVIGQISVQDGPNKENKSVRGIAVFLDHDNQKKGYAYEASKEVLKYMFLEVEIDSIITNVAMKNLNGLKLMEKLGFKRKKTTSFIKYTLLNEEVEQYEYELVKKEFLKEYFRKEDLYISEEIDKDPYIKHISDDLVLNVTGESGSGKSTAIEKYRNDSSCIVIDTDEIFSNHEQNGYAKEFKEHLIKKYEKLPNLYEEFDKIYKDIIDYFKFSNKMVIIDSAQFRNLKDISLLKGDIIILRTCINTCFNRCIERFKVKKKDATFEEIVEYSSRKKNIYNWYHSLNNFIDRVDNI